jgi:hypothetical protein
MSLARSIGNSLGFKPTDDIGATGLPASTLDFSAHTSLLNELSPAAILVPKYDHPIYGII